jgi:hypothetical protein
VFGHQGEAQFFEQGLQGVGNRGGELDELKATQAHGVVKQIGHVNLQTVTGPRGIWAWPDVKSVKKRGGFLNSLRRGARLAPRAAREVNTDDQTLDGHGPMVAARLSVVKR